MNLDADLARGAKVAGSVGIKASESSPSWEIRGCSSYQTNGGFSDLSDINNSPLFPTIRGTYGGRCVVIFRKVIDEERQAIRLDHVDGFLKACLKLHQPRGFSILGFCHFHSSC